MIWLMGHFVHHPKYKLKIQLSDCIIDIYGGWCTILLLASARGFPYMKLMHTKRTWIVCGGNPIFSLRLHVFFPLRIVNLVGVFLNRICDNNKISFRLPRSVLSIIYRRVMLVMACVFSHFDPIHAFSME